MCIAVKSQDSGAPDSSASSRPRGEADRGSVSPRWTVAEVAASVEAFLCARSHVSADDRRFSRQINLWEEGYVDSIGVIELIGHIEDTFEVALPDEVLFDPGFASIDGIARIVATLPVRRAP